MRTSMSPILALGLTNKEVLPGYEDLRTREDRAVEAYMLTRKRNTIVTERVWNHTGNRGDTAMVPLSWQTIGSKFSISLKQMDNNIFTWEEAYMNLLKNACLDLHEYAEIMGSDFLYANRSQVNNATALGEFNEDTDAFEVNDTQMFYPVVQAGLRANNYSGRLDIVADQMSFVRGEFQKAQGDGNSVNLAYQQGNMDVYESIAYKDANYTKGSVLVMPKGSFAVLPWIPKQNRNGSGNYFSYEGGYGSFLDLTGSGLTFAMHAYYQRADTSASNGSKQDNVLEVEVSVDLGFALSPTTVADETPVYEFAIVD